MSSESLGNGSKQNVGLEHNEIGWTYRICVEKVGQIEHKGLKPRQYLNPKVHLN